MDPDDHYLLVVRPVEHADSSALWEPLDASPQVIVAEFLRRRCFERVYLTTLWVQSGHNMLYGAVLARRVHCLEHDQHRVAVLRVKDVLVASEPLDVLL